MAGVAGCAIVAIVAVAQAGSRPDLSVKRLSIDAGTVVRGGSFGVSDRTANTGAAKAGRSKTGHYLSLDDRRSAGDKLIASRNVAGLRPRRASSGTVQARIPSATAPGSYMIVACADRRSQVRESNERNNCRATGPVEVTDPPPPNQPPLADFEYDPTDPEPAEQIELTSTSSDPDGAIASTAWDLDNDGQFDDAGGAQTSHSFVSEGVHRVRMRVTDDDGDRDTAAALIAVAAPANQPPVAGFNVNPVSPEAFEEASFTSTSSDPDGTIASYEWDLDNDGQFDDATGSAASRVFGVTGEYTIRLRVIDDDGASAVATEQVTVVAPANYPPIASFEYSPANPQAGDTVQFTSTANDPDGSISAREWDLDGGLDFDDGTGPTALKTFHGGGTFTVRLRVTDNGGKTATVSRQIVVSGSPDPDRDGDGALNGDDCEPDDPAIYPGAADEPDAAPPFVDSNCDGVDGTAADSIFVDLVDGSDQVGNGNRVNPVASITFGLDRAVALGRSGLIIAVGTYNEQVTLVNGISLYGGYEKGESAVPFPGGGLQWPRTGGLSVIRNTTVSSGRVIGLSATNITTPTQVQRMSIRARAGSGLGVSVYGVYSNFSGGLSLNNVDIDAGDGTAGANGGSGTDGSDGVSGQPGSNGSCPGTTGGAGGAGGAGVVGGVTVSGGSGGGGGSGESNPPRSGFDGGPGSSGGGSGGGGQGGTELPPGWDGFDGSDGADGADGSNGSAGTPGFLTAGFWAPGVGGSGASGVSGKGGGGGGGGGASSANRGNGGGGGGAGGARGTGATGGGSGGGSFGVFAVGTTLSNLPSIANSTIKAGNGGSGGIGGIGGIGGRGGLGGAGAAACHGQVGSGGDGGRGGRGGDAGHGGGGAGGPSYAIFRGPTGAAISTSTLILSSGSGGAGGPSLGNPGPPGPSGNVN